MREYAGRRIGSIFETVGVAVVDGVVMVLVVGGIHFQMKYTHAVAEVVRGKGMCVFARCGV